MAAACLMSGAAFAQPTEAPRSPHASNTVIVSDACTPGAAVQIVASMEAKAVHLVADLAPAAAHRPAHGGYPGLVLLNEWKSRGFGGTLRGLPASPQPGYRT
jgi:hypothetical protein